MRDFRLHLAAFAAIAVFFAACGGGEQQSTSESTANLEDAVPAEDPADPQPAAGSELAYGEDEVPLKPMQLADTRYMREMVREEITLAYGETGEFIDPRRIIGLLEEEADATAAQPQPQPQAQQDATPAPKSWRISYDVHNEAKALFDQGNYARAAQRWRNLSTDRRAFTLSVEIDCDPAVLVTGYAALRTLQMPVFILPERVEQRDCYRLCVGVFTDERSAREMIEEVKRRVPSSWPFALSFVGSGS